MVTDSQEWISGGCDSNIVIRKSFCHTESVHIILTGTGKIRFQSPIYDDRASDGRRFCHDNHLKKLRIAQLGYISQGFSVAQLCQYSF